MLKEVSEVKKGQVTIFVIIAIVIVGLGVLIYTFYPNLTGQGYSSSENPEEFLKGCLEEKGIEQEINKISMQGGSLNPELAIDYYGNKVRYLCYSEEYYKLCVVQEPMLKQNFENELYNAIQGKMQECSNELETSFREKGYSVNMEAGNQEINFLPGKIQIKFNNKLTLTKGDNSKSYDSVDFSINNDLYEILMIATNILKWETNYGDAETTTYMTYYRDIKVEKDKLSDGTTIYKITNRNSGDKFQFASRSVAWPPGYGVDGTITSATISE